MKALKYALALLPIAWILGRMELDQFHAAIWGTAAWTVPFVVISFYSVLLVQGLRWWLVQRVFVPDLSLRRTLAYHFVANAYSVLLPSSVSQDVVRTAMISRHVECGISWGAAWVTRILGLVAWLVLSLCGLAFVDSGLFPANADRALLASLAVIAVLTGLSFSKRATRPLRALAGRVVPARLLDVVERVREGVYQYRHRKLALVRLALLTAAIQLCVILFTSITIYGITHTFPFAALLVFIPLIEVVLVALPLTPGGLGFREAMVAALFAQLGFTEEQTGVYVTLGLLGVGLKALGGLPFQMGLGRKEREADAVGS